MNNVPKTFSEWVSEYKSFDLPALLAEVELADDIQLFSQTAAIFVRLLELIANSEMSDQHRLAGIRLANVIQQTLENATSADPTAGQSFDIARISHFKVLLKTSKYPEYIKLIIPEGFDLSSR